MSPAKLASLTHILRKTSELVGSRKKALEQMSSAAPAVARAMSIREDDVRAFVATQATGVAS